MKYKAYLLALLVLLVPMMVQGVSTDLNNNVEVSLGEISPFPVEPGQDFSVQLYVTNVGSDMINDLSVSYVVSKHFQLTGKEDNFESFSLSSHTTKSNLFYFHVEPDTPSGDYPIIFKVRSGSLEWEKTVFVRVTGKPDIILRTDRESFNVIPGNDVDFNLTIKNVGTGTARKVKIVPEGGLVIIPGSETIFIDKLEPGEKLVKRLRLVSSKEANTVPTEIGFNVECLDEDSNSLSFSRKIGINFVSNVSLDVSSLRIYPSLLQIGKEGEISLRIENLGQGDADEVTVELESNKLRGIKKAYIGRLKEGEDSQATFLVIPDSMGKIDMKFVISYKDDLGVHKKIVNFNGYVYPAKSIVGYLLVGLLIVALLVGYKIVKKKK